MKTERLSQSGLARCIGGHIRYTSHRHRVHTSNTHTHTISCWSGSVYLYHAKRSYQRLCILYRDRVSDPPHAIMMTSSSKDFDYTTTTMPSLDDFFHFVVVLYVLFLKLHERRMYVSFDDRLVRYDRCRDTNRFREHVLAVTVLDIFDSRMT